MCPHVPLIWVQAAVVSNPRQGPWALLLQSECPGTKLSDFEQSHSPLTDRRCRECLSALRWGIPSSHWAGGRSHWCIQQLAPLSNQKLPQWNPLFMPDEWRGRPLFAVLGRSNLLLRPIFTTSRYLLSAPTFQEVLGNPVKRTTNTVTASEIMLERA